MVMAACTGAAAVLLGTLYLIHRDMVLTGGCGSRSGRTCSGEQSGHIFAALVVMPASAACLMFLNRVVFRPYRWGQVLLAFRRPVGVRGSPAHRGMPAGAVAGSPAAAPGCVSGPRGTRVCR
jgi:hypothetical protein